MLGCTLFYGDSVVTPAISVLSALEGVSVASSDLAGRTMPMAVAVLLLLFLSQRFGSGAVGRFLGPIMCLWFMMLAVTGAEQIARQPRILEALNPLRAVRFLDQQRQQGTDALFTALGTIVLAVTGGESLYADMGHFGAAAIRWAWFLVVLPSVTMSYLGQGALLLRDPSLASNPFYNMFPAPLVIPAVVLSTLATMIASNSCISGAFSLTNQARAARPSNPIGGLVDVSQPGPPLSEPDLARYTWRGTGRARMLLRGNMAGLPCMAARVKSPPAPEATRGPKKARV